MSNSSYVSYTQISPNKSSPRNHEIDKITIHHAACVNASLKGLGNGFAKPTRNASANYGIDSNGNIGMYVEECDRAWTSSSPENDNRAVTIEVANSKGSPNWEVSNKALDAIIKLCIDICKRNNIKALNFTGNSEGNLTMHCYFAKTSCPGPYLKSKFKYIADEVNKALMSETVEFKVNFKSDDLEKIKKFDELSETLKELGAEIERIPEKKSEQPTPIIEPIPIPEPASIPEPTPIPEPAIEITVDLEINDKVKLLSDAVNYSNGKKFSSWVYKSTLYVREISGNRIVISTVKTGAITGAVERKYLSKL